MASHQQSTQEICDLESRKKHEESVKRNPHPDFKAIEASRPRFEKDSEGGAWTSTQTPNPDWSFGEGGNDGGASLEKKHVEIDPYEDGRPSVLNYKLMISGIVPRPIGFLSTLSADEKNPNLAPFSFMNMVNYDPPMFTVGFTGCGIADAKDTLRNLVNTKECVLNIISEHFVEAANSTSINAPPSVNEWTVSGLHPAPSTHVLPCRVQESIFSVECRLASTTEFESKDPEKAGKKSGTLAVLEGVNFWVREDAVNEEKSIIDPAVLKPVTRLGGITYGRVTRGFELLRPRLESWEDAQKERNQAE